MSPFAAAEQERQVAATRAALGEERFAAAWVAGQTRSVDEILSYALEEGDPF